MQGWSVNCKTQGQKRPAASWVYDSEGRHRVVRKQYEVRNWTSSSEGDDQRWVSIFGSCWEFHNALVIAKHIYTHDAKNVTNFTFLHFAVLNSCFVFFFFPSTLCLFYFFVQLSQVWEEMMGSTPLNDQTANPLCLYYYSKYNSSKSTNYCRHYEVECDGFFFNWIWNSS